MVIVMTSYDKKLILLARTDDVIIYVIGQVGRIRKNQP